MSPIALIPDFIPVIGLLDEVFLLVLFGGPRSTGAVARQNSGHGNSRLPLAMSGIIRLIPPKILNEHRVKAKRWLRSLSARWLRPR